MFFCFNAVTTISVPKGYQLISTNLVTDIFKSYKRHAGET